MVMMMVLLLSKGETLWVVGRWVGTIWYEWVIRSHPGVEWWESMPDETVNLLVHSSLSNIFLVVLLMMSVLVLGQGSIMGR